MGLWGGQRTLSVLVRSAAAPLQIHPYRGQAHTIIGPSHKLPPSPSTAPQALSTRSHLGMVMAWCRKFSNFFWNVTSCASSVGSACPGGECWQGQQPCSGSASSAGSSRLKRVSWLLVGSRRPVATGQKREVKAVVYAPLLGTRGLRHPPTHPLRTAVAVVVDVEVAVLCQSLPQH